VQIGASLLLVSVGRTFTLYTLEDISAHIGTVTFRTRRTCIFALVVRILTCVLIPTPLLAFASVVRAQINFFVTDKAGLWSITSRHIRAFGTLASCFAIEGRVGTIVLVFSAVHVQTVSSVLVISCTGGALVPNETDSGYVALPKASALVRTTFAGSLTSVEWILAKVFVLVTEVVISLARTVCFIAHSVVVANKARGRCFARAGCGAHRATRTCGFARKSRVFAEVNIVTKVRCGSAVTIAVVDRVSDESILLGAHQVLGTLVRATGTCVLSREGDIRSGVEVGVAGQHNILKAVSVAFDTILTTETSCACG